MLVLSRKPNECVVIDGRIIVKVIRVEGEVVKIGIDAPLDVPVHRQEVYAEIQGNNRAALTRKGSQLPRLPKPRRPDSRPGAALTALTVRTDGAPTAP